MMHHVHDADSRGWMWWEDAALGFSKPSLTRLWLTRIKLNRKLRADLEPTDNMHHGHHSFMDS